MTTIKLYGGVRKAYDDATGTWTGCDWTTDHGSTNLNLDGESADDLRRYADGLESSRYDDADDTEAQDEWDRIPKPDSVDDWAQLDRREIDDAEYESITRNHRQAWIDDLRSGADWLEECASAAASAEEYAAEAMRHIEAGDISRAIDAAKSASRCESEYGDDPAWGAFRRAVEELAE